MSKLVAAVASMSLGVILAVTPAAPAIAVSPSVEYRSGCSAAFKKAYKQLDLKVFSVNTVWNVFPNLESAIKKSHESIKYAKLAKKYARNSETKALLGTLIDEADTSWVDIDTYLELFDEIEYNVQRGRC